MVSFYEHVDLNRHHFSIELCKIIAWNLQHQSETRCVSLSPYGKVSPCKTCLKAFITGQT